ncbi:MAG: SgcJ/EcaC family oxidoreductase [Terriglobales bacterium]
MKKVILLMALVAVLATGAFGKEKKSAKGSEQAVQQANAAIDRWSAAYSANDVDAVTNSYWPDAILLGTKSPVISTGSEAIKKYFTDLKLAGSGNKNTIQERHSIPAGKDAVVVTGFYEFTRMQEGKPVPGPSRFTMLVTKRGNEWRIAHHHSSPRVMPAAAK